MDVQWQIDFMRFQGTPSACAIKAFKIGRTARYRFRVSAKDHWITCSFRAYVGGTGETEGGATLRGLRSAALL